MSTIAVAIVGRVITFVRETKRRRKELILIENETNKIKSDVFMEINKEKYNIVITIKEKIIIL